MKGFVQGGRYAHTTPVPVCRLAAQQAGVPVTMLDAIALQKNGMTLQGRHVSWPWSLNVAGLAPVNVGYQPHRSRNPANR